MNRNSNGIDSLPMTAMIMMMIDDNDDINVILHILRGELVTMNSRISGKCISVVNPSLLRRTKIVCCILDYSSPTINALNYTVLCSKTKSSI